MIYFTEKDVKPINITIFHMFKKIEEIDRQIDIK